MWRMSLKGHARATLNEYRCTGLPSTRHGRVRGNSSLAAGGGRSVGLASGLQSPHGEGWLAAHGAVGILAFPGTSGWPPFAFGVAHLALQ